MNVVSSVLLGLIVACSFLEGFGAAVFVDGPSSGSVVANFEGAINATTLTCDVTIEGVGLIDTSWSVANFQGIGPQRSLTEITDQNLFLTRGSRFNELTISNWTSEIDQVIVFCGGGLIQPTQANVTLRLYRSPTLRDNFAVKIQEGDLNVPVDLLQESAAFPEPSSFEWLKDGRPLRQNGLTTTYSSVMFSSVMRSDDGSYTVNATNFLLDNATQPVGNDIGSFTLDVLYPPSFGTEGPTERYVLLGDSLSLICGTALDSNPAATITWTASDATTISMNGGRYTLDNGPEIVRLNFSSTRMSDNGVWRCNVMVTSNRYVAINGELFLQTGALIGSITQDIQLTVIATPGPPSVPAVENIGATWARVCWDAPMMADSPISRYQIIAREVGGQGIVTENTTTNATMFNITGLLPATAYSFTVVAISEGGDVIAVSQEGPAIQDMTGFTVPEVQCFDPVSANGFIMVRWTFVHTGGLSLTGLSGKYSYVDGTSTVNEPVTISSLDTTSVNVSGLVAGFDYTFSITAENSNGSSTVLCRPTPHIIGVPREPQFGNSIESGPGTGEVTLEIKTVASGVNNPDQEFQFIITPELNGDTLDPIRFDFPNYQSGMLESITVRGLEQGRSYIFSATAMNNFGESSPANSPSVRAGGPTVPPPPNTQPSANPPIQNNNIGPAVGGAVGGILAVVIIVAIVIVIVVILLVFCRGKGDYRPKKAEGVQYERAPTSDNGTKVQEVNIDIGEDMGRKDDTEIQYAELDTFRPPSQQKNVADKPTKPVELEEPVEYAIITNFKKKEDDPAPTIVETSAVPDPTPDTTTTSEGDADKTGTSTTLV